MESYFDQEIQEKKLIARSARAKTNGRRKNRSMFPADLLKGKAKKEYTKGGEIKLSNLWDQLITKEEYLELSDEQKKNAMEHWRTKFTTGLIKKALGWNDYNLYKEFDRVGVQVAKRPARKGKAVEEVKKKAAAAAKKAEDEAAVNLNKAATLLKQIEQDKEQAAQPVIQAQILPAAQTGISLYLNDEYTPEEAINKLMKYAAFLEGETNKIKIRLEICEVKEK